MTVPSTNESNLKPLKTDNQKFWRKRSRKDRGFVVRTATTRYGGKKSPVKSGTGRTSSQKKKQKYKGNVKIQPLAEATSDYFDDDDVSTCSQSLFLSSKSTKLQLGDYIFQGNSSNASCESNPKGEVLKKPAEYAYASHFEPSLLWPTAPKEKKRWPSAPKLPSDSPLIMSDPWLPPDWSSMFTCFINSQGKPKAYKTSLTDRGLVDLDTIDPCSTERPCILCRLSILEPGPMRSTCTGTKLTM